VTLPVQTYYSLFTRLEQFIELNISGFKADRTLYAITGFHLNQELTIDEDL